MTPSHPQIAPAHGSASTPTHRERLNSLSTRIILFVFLSTTMTAGIASWLGAVAAFDDNRERIAARNGALLFERGAQLDAWRAAAQAALVSATAPGAPLRDEIEAVLPSAGNTVYIPVPADLADHFDRLEVGAPPRLPRAVAEADDAPCLPLEHRVTGPNGPETTAFFVRACLAETGLLSILRPPVGEFRGSRMLVVDANGEVQAAGGVRARSRIGAFLRASAPMNAFTAGRPASPAHAVSLLRYPDPEGVVMVASMWPLQGTPWKLVVEAARTHAFAPATAVVKQLVVVDVCLILLFTVLAYRITTAIVHPIEALSQGAQRIARGQVDYQIPAPPNPSDELGLLTRTFNEMMGRLRSSQLEIEQDRVRLGEKNEELQQANEVLSQLSITDGLTKLHNHRYFQDHLTREIKRVSRTQAPLTLILIDIDDFKVLNDTHGHAAGDEVLMSLAAIMNDSARESDLIARYGGEEFVVLMPNTDVPGAVHLAEKIRMTVESTRLIIGDTLRPVDVTISVGVAKFEGDRREFFAAADRALYQAKAAGKNCVVIAEREDAPVPDDDTREDAPSA